MKRLIKIFFCTIFLFSCKTPIVKKISKNLININESIETNSFDFLNQSILGKEIFIIGEASHGDGKSFELKSELVKHLVEKKNYDVFAFEGRDFFEMEYINGRPSLEGVFDISFKQNWVRKWSPWGPSKQIQTLVNLFFKGDLEYIGLEPCNSKSSLIAFNYLKNQLNFLNLNFYDPEQWELLSMIHKNINSYENTVSIEQYKYYIETLENLYYKLSESNNSEIFFLIQIIENSITSAKIARLESHSMTEDELNESVNIRDSQMAKNLIWYKKIHQKSKIIVWMANFHAAKKLSVVDYADGDIARYSKFTVFGEHIIEKYGPIVFSLGLTSSKGKSKMPYNFEGVEEITIKAPDNSLEKELDLKNINYGYIDFNELKKRKPKLKESKFNSIMLGYINQDGKWLNVFDGLLYIRENNIAIPIN